MNPGIASKLLLTSLSLIAASRTCSQTISMKQIMAATGGCQ
jgi:hypothetical protein